MRTLMSGKIHRATVTQADVDYEGSITIDPDLIEAAGILPYEKVHVLDIANGNRLETYVIKGRRGSRDICINGAAAHLVHKGDLVIIVAYQQLTESELEGFRPKKVFVDRLNRIVRTDLGDGYADLSRPVVAV